MLTRRGALGAALALPALRRGAAAQAGAMRIAIDTSLSTLDPLKATLGCEYIYDVLVFNGLTRMREDLTVEPELAESWAVSEENRRWTFRLRKGVKFHDGRELVAADVVASFERLLDPATVAPTRTNYTMIAKVGAPDPGTVVFDLHYPYGGFAEILSDRQVKIVPRDAVATLPTAPVGSGPFKFVSYAPGDRLVLARNPDYFEAGLPKLAGVELRIMPEVASRIAALQAGDIDVLWDLPLDQMATLGQRAGVRVESVPTASWDAAVMNNALPPFNDVRVRRAFHMALDKREVVEAVLFGQGTPTVSPIPSSHPFFAADIPYGPADLQGARKLLAEAGHGGGVRLPLYVPVGRPVRERLGVTLQQMLKPVGFDFQIQRVPLANYEAQVLGKVPIWIDGFFGRPTTDTSTYPFLHSEGTWNKILFQYRNPKSDDLLDRARRSSDTAEQKQLYTAFQHELVADPPGFFAYSLNFACAYRAAVKGVRTHPNRWFDLRSATVD